MGDGALPHLVAGEVELEPGGRDGGVDAGLGEDAADAGAVLELEFDGAEAVGAWVDVEEHPGDAGAHAAVCGPQGGLVDAVGDPGFAQFEGASEGGDIAERIAADHGELFRPLVLGGDAVGGFLAGFGDDEGGAVADGDGFRAAAEFPAQAAGVAEPESALGGDGFLERGQPAFLDEFRVQGADALLFAEEGFDGCEIGLATGDGGGEEEGGELEHAEAYEWMGNCILNIEDWVFGPWRSGF
jgi:hypothetical protein